jgi:predicted pyridoxine 5'-phosphate oxidase superfamily flavin-nucleotide-binding protein
LFHIKAIILLEWARTTRLIQERTGERELALLNGRMIADQIPAAARSFVADQRICVCAGLSTDRHLWAHFLTGAAGFAAVAEDLKSVGLHLADSRGVLRRTPLFSALEIGTPLGMLFIDLATRRRLRVNGNVAEITRSYLRMAVNEAYPNCPKYIQRRQIAEVSPTPSVTEIAQGVVLEDSLAQWIRTSDTLFVASAHPDGRVDASHRGGNPGFVRVSENALQIPDYAGNSMFNTLGNFAVNPLAGLTFVDFDRARQLQLTGEVELRFDVESDAELTGGTGRWWIFRPRRWIVSPLNQPLAWKYVDASRFNPGAS